MHEEQAFLSAMMTNPDDQTTKLVYADWLADRGDPREEIVRLSARLGMLTRDDPIAPFIRARLAVLETTVSGQWFVCLGGPVWCVVGNIIATRPAGVGGEETRHGTRLFKPNAKVYLADLWQSQSILSEGPAWFDRIRVVGRHRKSLDWISCILRTDYITNWRVDLVYQPGALARLRKESWRGFQLQRGDYLCPEEKGSREAIRGLLEVLNRPLGN